jgi:hypothetical protein
MNKIELENLLLNNEVDEEKAKDILNSIPPEKIEEFSADKEEFLKQKFKNETDWRIKVKIAAEIIKNNMELGKY